MKEHGLIYQAWGVRAILAGNKTMTRRIVSFHNSVSAFSRKLWPELDFDAAWVDGGPSPAGNPGPYLKVPFPITDGFLGHKRHDTVHRIYPRYQVGDVMWGREAHGIYHGPHCPWPDLPHASRLESAKVPREFAFYKASFDRSPMRWRSPIHMPRWVARIVKPIIQVVCQRVQEISEEDAKAEGIMEPEPVHGHWSYRKPFADAWNSIHGPGAWERNDWVWGLRW